MRKNYMIELIKGVREENKRHMEEHHADLLEEYPDCSCGHILDSELLCMVIEKDVLDDEKT